MEGGAIYGGDIILPRTGSDEPVPGVTPCWTSVRKCDIYQSTVALRRTGSDQIVDNAVSTVDPGGPGYETGSVMNAPGDVLVRSSECRGVDKGTLDTIRMWGVNSRSAVKVHYEPPPPNPRCYM